MSLNELNGPQICSMILNELKMGLNEHNSAQMTLHESK